VSVDVPTWRSVAELSWDHRDPADRIIVVTAQQRDAVLITSDRTIASFYAKTIW
jgi:PIN domain nuclease of toxin-antitoxin system